MSLVRDHMLKEIEKEFADHPYAFFSQYDKLSVNGISLLRNKLAKTGNRSMVMKHTLAKKALKNLNAVDAEKFLKNSVFVTFAKEDPQITSKALVDFAKDNKQFIAEGVFFEKKVYDQAFVKQLASLPSRKELLTQVAVRMKSPMTAFAMTLNQLLRNMAVVLNEVKKLKETEQGQAA